MSENCQRVPGNGGRATTQPIQEARHELIKVERECLYFICPANPKLEMVRHGVPVRCPICRAMNPVKLGTEERAPMADGYEPDGAEALRLAGAGVV